MLREFQKNKTIREQITSPEFHEYIKANPKYKINVQQIMKEVPVMDILVAGDGFFVEKDYCFEEGTRILTKEGWKCFSQVTINDYVWQVDPTSLVGNWVHPSRILWRKYQGKIHVVGNRRGKLSITEGHTMLYAGQRHKTRKDKEKLRWVNKVEEGLPSKGSHLVLATKGDQGQKVDKHTLWLSCMLQADAHLVRNSSTGSWCGSYSIQVSKPRKREKVRELLKRNGSISPPNKSQTLEKELWCGIRVTSPILEEKFLHLTKVCRGQAEEVFDALGFWDGYIDTRGGLHYFTKNRKQAEEVQIYFVTAGWSAKVVETINQKYGSLFTVRVLKKDRIRLRSVDFKEEYKECFVGCVTVPSGFVLVEKDGQAFVSGNCSLEPTVLAELSGDPTYKEIYASGKPHDNYLFTSIRIMPWVADKINAVYNIENPTKESVKAAKDAFKSERGMAKPIFLSGAYKAGALKQWRMLKLLGYKLPFDVVKEMRDNFWGPNMFGTVLQYEKELQEEVEWRGRYLLNGVGRPFVVLKHKVKDVLNINGQSTGHCILDIGNMFLSRLVIERGINARCVIEDWHDERVWWAPTREDAEELKKAMEDSTAMLNEFLSPQIPIRGEVEICKRFTAFKNPEPWTLYPLPEGE